MYRILKCTKPGPRNQFKFNIQQIDIIHVQISRDQLKCSIYMLQVYHVGICNTCKAYMQKHGLDKAAMFFQHVRRVLEYIKSRYPHLTCIMWDDMFRGLETERLKGTLKSTGDSMSLTF